jgi:hypothetical protein
MDVADVILAVKSDWDGKPVGSMDEGSLKKQAAASAPPKVSPPSFQVSMDDDFSRPVGPNRDKSAEGKPLPKSTSETTLPVETERSAEEALAREKALVANLPKMCPQIAPTVQIAEAGCFWAVWSQAQPWLDPEAYGRSMEISKVAIKICRHGWDRRDSDGSFSMARLMAAVNEKIFRRDREIGTLRELLVSFKPLQKG